MHRWPQRNRRETWRVAEDALQDLGECDTPRMRGRIKREAEGKGYWSVWMTVFKEDGDMVRRFIEGCPGTCAECFDDDLRPVPRNPNGL